MTKQITSRPAQSDDGFEVSNKPGRNIVRWRTPAFGYVDMYIGPQSIRISDSKIYTSTRTKAGFIYQYAGEDLTKISITGTTGSSGIEGINVLEAVYRSEQIGFSGLATALDQSVAATKAAAATTNVISGLLAGTAGQTVLSAIQPALNVFSQPTPSLATLATAVELQYQGVIYRGYFESFSVDENASSAGLFDYSISFVAFTKIGERQNFMPWHRRADQISDSSNLNLLTFGKAENPVAVGNLTTPTQQRMDYPGIDTSDFKNSGNLRGRDLIATSSFDLRDED